MERQCEESKAGVGGLAYDPPVTVETMSGVSLIGLAINKKSYTKKGQYLKDEKHIYLKKHSENKLVSVCVSYKSAQAFESDHETATCSRKRRAGVREIVLRSADNCCSQSTAACEINAACPFRYSSRHSLSRTLQLTVAADRRLSNVTAAC